MNIKVEMVNPDENEHGISIKKIATVGFAF